MKKLLFLVCMSMGALLPTSAQDMVYRNLKDFLVGKGDTVTTLKLERRSRSQVMMTGGADYKLTASEAELRPKFLRSRCAIARYEDKLYVNCKKLRYKKLQFGSWYAPAFLLRGNIYFAAIPLGSVAAGNEAMEVKLGGTVGDAIAASSLVTRRVCYAIDPLTGEVDFIGKDNMMILLKDSPDLLKSYLNEENCESAEVTTKYLFQLKEVVR